MGRRPIHEFARRRPGAVRQRLLRENITDLVIGNVVRHLNALPLEFDQHRCTLTGLPSLGSRTQICAGAKARIVPTTSSRTPLDSLRYTAFMSVASQRGPGGEPGGRPEK